MTDNLPQLTDDQCLKEYGWTKSRFEVIQRTYFKDLTHDDIAIFSHVCRHVGLDPFLRQIYPVIRDTKQKDGSKKPTMSIQTGIDGYRAVAERTGKYSPGKEPLFRYDKDGRLFSATAYVMKMTNDGKWHEIAATAIMSEYRPTFQNDFWASKPHIMLSKCAEALALRKAFPMELSGVYTKEEMDQAKDEDPDKNLDQLPQADCEVNECKAALHEEPVKQEELISNEQAVVFSDFWKLCSEEGKGVIMAKLKLYGIQRFRDIPLIHYKTLLDFANDALSIPPKETT